MKEGTSGRQTDGHYTPCPNRRFLMEVNSIKHLKMTNHLAKSWRTCIIPQAWAISWDDDQDANSQSQVTVKPFEGLAVPSSQGGACHRAAGVRT